MMKLKHYSAITCTMSDDEQKKWEADVEEASAVIEKLFDVLNKKCIEVDKKICLDTVRKSSGDATIALLTLIAERDALRSVITLIEPQPED